MDRSDIYRDQEAKAKEYAHNRTLLNKCSKTYKWLIIAYLFALTFFPLLSFFLMLGSVFAEDTIFLTFESFIVYSLSIYCAWQAAYRKRDLFVIFVGITAVVNQLILGVFRLYAKGEYLKYFKFDSIGYTFKIHLFLLAVILVIVVINMAANIVYHRLEEADGFPHFSERFYDQDMDRKQAAIKDPYQTEFERLKKSASDSMSELTAPDDEIDEYIDDYRNNFMDDV